MARVNPCARGERVRLAAAVGALPVMAGMLSGCLVAGYTAGRGWFVWPGGVGLVIMLLVLLFLLRGKS